MTLLLSLDTSAFLLYISTIMSSSERSPIPHPERPERTIKLGSDINMQQLAEGTGGEFLKDGKMETIRWGLGWLKLVSTGIDRQRRLHLISTLGQSEVTNYAFVQEKTPEGEIDILTLVRPEQNSELLTITEIIDGREHHLRKRPGLFDEEIRRARDMALKALPSTRIR